MPILEEEEASGTPDAKARKILNLNQQVVWDSTPVNKRQWIDIEVQESKDPHVFYVSKFIIRLLRHSN